MKKTRKITVLVFLMIMSTIISIKAADPYDIELTWNLERQSSTIFIVKIDPLEDGYDTSDVVSVDYVFFSWYDSSDEYHEEYVDVTYWHIKGDTLQVHIEASEKPNPEKGSHDGVAIVYGKFTGPVVFISTGPSFAWGRGR